MFLTKLKLMVGAVMVVTVLGASGLVYRATGQSAAPTEKQSDGKPKSELERLRHENEMLKLNLEVVLEKVRAQETELRTLRGRVKSAGKAELNKAEIDKAIGYLQALRQLDMAKSDAFMWQERAAWSKRMSQPGRQYVTVGQAEADEAHKTIADLAVFEGELKVLREAPDAEALQKATDTLEKALKQLRSLVEKQNSKQPQGGKKQNSKQPDRGKK